MDIKPSEYHRLKDIVYEYTGLTVDDTRRSLMEHSMTGILADHGLPSVLGLLNALPNYPLNHRLWQQVINNVTIGETYFFRNAFHFKALLQSVLPDIIQKRRSKNYRHLSLWSAGCATGEEPYSLAIALRELIPDISEWTISILATDINQDSLETARKGFYKDRSFRNETREGVLDRWFTSKDRGYQIDPTIQRMVNFAPLNLVEGRYPSFETRTLNLDLIICRNVTIYFKDDVTQQIITRFHQALNTDGWLVVGHAEPLASIYKEFLPHNYENAVLYQKHEQEVIVVKDERSNGATKPLVPREKRQRAATKPLNNDATRQTISPSARERLQRAREKSSQKPAPQPAPQPAALTEANAITWRQVKAAMDREDWDKAVDLLAAVERTNPMDPEVHYLRALLMMNAGATDDAYQALRRSIYCDPSFALAHYALGELHEERGNYAEAARCWKLSERAVSGLAADYVLPFDEELNVEMFKDMLATRLTALPQGGRRK